MLAHQEELNEAIVDLREKNQQSITELTQLHKSKLEQLNSTLRELELEKSVLEAGQHETTLENSRLRASQETAQADTLGSRSACTWRKNATTR